MRVALVELVVRDRFFYTWEFPDLKGRLRARGVPGRWLRLGVPSDTRFVRGEQGVGLDAGDREILVSSLATFRATHAVFSTTPAASLVDAVRGTCPDLVITALAGDSLVRRSPTGVALLPSTEAVAAHLGLPPVDPRESVDPDYGYEAANEEARRSAPVVPLHAGPDCIHRLPLGRSRFFAERRLDEVPDEYGCTFCMVPIRASDPVFDPSRAFSSLERCLAAAARTHPRVDQPIHFRVLGVAAAGRPDRLARAVLDAGVPSGRFLLDYRADQLVRAASALRRGVEMIASAGHRIDVNLIGIESFSAAQLDRYNKGYGPETNLACVRTLLEVEAEHPRSFAFRQYRGLSTVLFDPWTTLGDIALNLECVHRLGVEDLFGKLLTSRLRLHPGLPLTAAARADGLLTEGYDDPLFETARRNFYPDELPWRFVDPLVEQITRVLVRLPRDVRPQGDRLAERVARWRGERAQSPLALAREVVRAATALPPGADAEEILERAMTDAGRAAAVEMQCGLEPAARPWLAARYLERLVDEGIDGAAALRAESTKLSASGRARVEDLVSGTPTRDAITAALEAMVDPRRADLEFAVARATGARPCVAKIDMLRTEEAVQETLAWMARHERAPVTRVRRCIRDSSWELFVAATEADAELAVQTADTIERESDEERARAAIAAMGVQLGYPPCCAAAFAASSPVLRKSNELHMVRRRLEAPDRLPCPHVDLRALFVPCSLTCAAALASIAEHRVAADEWVALMASLPTVLFLDRPGETVHVQALEPVSERFRYRVVQWNTSDARIEALRCGDTLVVEPGLLRVFTAGRESAFFALDAFLWTSERVLHRDFWSEYLAILGRRAAAPPAHETLPPDPSSSESLRELFSGSPLADPAPDLADLVRDRLSSLPLSGYRLGRVSVPHQDRVQIVLHHPRADVRLLLAPSRSVKHAFVRSGGVAIMVPKSSARGAEGVLAQDAARRLAAALSAEPT